MLNTIEIPTGTDAPSAASEASLLTSRPDNPVRRGPVLLALHGSEPTAAPIVVARQVAQRLGVGLQVISIVEPSYVFSGVGLGLVAVPSMYADFGPIQEGLIKSRLYETCADLPWELSIRYGQPAQEIAHRAGEVNATMIIVGAAPHRGLRHEVSGVRALQVLRRAPCPVVSVAPDATALPMTVVSAIDFSPASIRAAEAALLTLGEGGTLILAHVPLPVPLRRSVTEHTGAVYASDIGETFERLRAELRPLLPHNVTLETRQLEGTVSTALLELANAINADLITVGRHSRNVIERLFVGSVATTVLHGATCSVLVSPDPSAAETVRLRLRMTDTAVADKPGEWADVLAAASARNAGRKVMLEEDDPAIGAQVQASGFVLSGIDYDERTRRVDVMLGHGAESDAHLTRTIVGVNTIAIKAGPDGSDQAIDLDHGKGRTLVSFDL